MKILITGCAGFIGMHLSKKLLQKHEVIGLDNINSYYDTKLKKDRLKILKKNKKFSFFKTNIINFRKLSYIFKKTKPSIVIHLASEVGVRNSTLRPRSYVNTNILGFLNILESCKNTKVNKLFYASSSSVYGNPKRIPIVESDDKNPINPYAETKLKKEELAINYAKNGVKVIGLRYFNVFGKGQSNEYAGVLKLFLECIKEKLPPKINGDGTQFRDFVHVNDVVNANIMSMDSKVDHEFFNVGTNTSITILDLAKTIIKSSKLDIKPIFGPALKGDVQETIANIDLIKDKIGWKPTIILKDWINEIITKNQINEI